MNPGTIRRGPPVRRGLELVDYAEAMNDCTEFKLRNLNGNKDRWYALKFWLIGSLATNFKLWLNGRTGDTVGSTYHVHDTAAVHTVANLTYAFLGKPLAADDICAGDACLFAHPNKNALMETEHTLYTGGTNYTGEYSASAYWANTDKLSWLLLQADVAKGIAKGSWIAIYRDPMFGGRRDRD